ncbi:hypothetical protein WL51_06940 [Burkholderia ubonensis]|uniref:phage protein Gp27 family protein n=1 Tax=Burkholderia ubonensis TaxID=101571 RepID=UPI000752FB53|nr:phage protein Gp27 family protein [Burkholderia ubonensis]KWC40819.1 hypothetical protein WL51_06940 [Burkholderia ubonensis]
MTVTQLPRPILTTLHDELVRRDFAEYHEIAALLAKAGHPVSKSALHRYVAQYEAEIRADVARRRRGADAIAVRLRCLEIAARMPSADDVIATAERFLGWVSGAPDGFSNPCK